MMKEYEMAIEYYASKKINNLMHNGGSAQALIVFKNIFKNATSHIRIAAKSLDNKEVVNTYEYISSIKSFLEKENSKLDILLTKFNDEVINIGDNNFFKFLKDSKAYKDNRVVIKDAKGKSFKIEEKVIHFCTADSCMYRVEIDINQRKARCNFGDRSLTEKLEKSFDTEFSQIVKTINLNSIFTK